MHKGIKVINRNILIIRFKEEEEITERNEFRVTVKAKNVLLNYTEAISNFL